MHCMNRIDVAKGIFVIDGLVEPIECEALVRRAEQSGFEPLPIITARGTRVDTATRVSASTVIALANASNGIRTHRSIGRMERSAC